MSIRKKCYHCGSKDLVKNGKATNGKQRYRCRECGGYSRRNPSHNGYTEEKKALILKAYEERVSLRGLKRLFGVAPQTVLSWIKKKPKNSRP